MRDSTWGLLAVADYFYDFETSSDIQRIRAFNGEIHLRH